MGQQRLLASEALQTWTFRCVGEDIHIVGSILEATIWRKCTAPFSVLRRRFRMFAFRELVYDSPESAFQ